MSRKNQTTLVWDSVKSPPAGCQGVVLWKSFDCDSYPDAISMPKLIDKNDVEIKKQYLKLIYDLGVKNVNGKTVIDHMQIREGFNYWWMTLIVEKCNYSKSTWIDDAIRMLAFEDWSVNQKIKILELVTANKILVKCFRLFCERNAIIFKCVQLPEVKERLSWLKRIFYVLPKPLKALMWLGHYVVSRWPLKGTGVKEWESTEGRITFVSYSDNLALESINKGRFNSYYWAHLPEVLLKDGKKTNWLHIYVKDAVLPSAKKAANTVALFNKNGQGNQVHSTLDSFLGWKVIQNSFLDWIRLLSVIRKLNINNLIDISEKNIFWPLIQIDLKESFFGRTALNNLINFNLFQEALRSLPKQTKCVYLQENQGWEFGLIQAWKAAGNGTLIGVPHSTVRFWDLRYFFDSRSYHNKTSNQLPRPDMVAVNGKASRKSYLQSDYPKNELVDVEALRYLHLKTLSEKRHTNSNNIRPIRILVLGDYVAENTNYLMRILEEAYSSFPTNIKILVKPHPNCPIIPSDFPGVKMDVTMGSISSLLPKCNVAYTSNITSAAIDAYCSNVPVISVLEPRNLNLSPLRGFRGVYYINTAEELTSALNTVLTKQNGVFPKRDYFFIDSSLIKWRRLLLAN